MSVVIVSDASSRCVSPLHRDNDTCSCIDDDTCSKIEGRRGKGGGREGGRGEERERERETVRVYASAVSSCIDLKDLVVYEYTMVKEVMVYDSGSSRYASAVSSCLVLDN